MNKEIIDYILKSREVGQSDEQIKENLLRAGWSQQDISIALVSKKQEVEPQSQTQSQISSISNKLPSIGNLFKRTKEVYENRFWTFTGFVLIYTLLFLIQSIVGFYFKAVENPSLLLALSSILYFIIIWIVSSWLGIALICAIRDREENIGVKESLKRSWSKILPLAWVIFLTTLIISGGSVFLIIPGIIFVIWFFFSGLILITEDIRGMNALLKSREYVKGNWWLIVGRILAILIPISLMLAGITGAATLVLFLFGMSPQSNLLEYFLMFIAFLPWIFYAVFSIFFLIYTFLLYEDLKKLRADLVFVPQKKEKTIFSIIGILGILGFLAILIVPVTLRYLDISKSQEIQNTVIGQESEVKKQEIQNNALVQESGVKYITPVLFKNININDNNLLTQYALWYNPSESRTSFSGVIKSMDIDTFTVFSDTLYYKDKNFVYYNANKIEGADSATFVVYDNVFAKDKNRTYLSGIVGTQTLDAYLLNKKLDETKDWKIFNSSDDLSISPKISFKYPADFNDFFVISSRSHNAPQFVTDEWMGIIDSKNSIYLEFFHIRGTMLEAQVKKIITSPQAEIKKFTTINGYRVIGIKCPVLNERQKCFGIQDYIIELSENNLIQLTINPNDISKTGLPDLGFLDDKNGFSTLDKIIATLKTI